MDKILHDIVSRISKNDERIIIGISGHGASGKTTFANNLIKLLKKENINYMNTDTYIIDSKLRKYAAIDYEYNNESRHYKMTACHPAAHHILALERDLKMIRAGLDLYTIETHYMKSMLLSLENKVNIIEGMTVAFVDYNLFDFTVYLYTDGETELKRRSERDIKERGASINYLRQSHEERRAQYHLFMHRYCQNFDIVIKNTNEEIIVEKAFV